LRTYVYAGSFDPVTNGHMDIIKRAAKQCGKLIVAVLVNSSKTPCFTTQERVEMLKKSVSDLGNVEVESFSGLLVEFMAKRDAFTIIKGLRAVSDFEYEMQMALLNKKLSPNIETLFMITGLRYSFLSSSMVRELAKNNGDIAGFVPDEIKEEINAKLKPKSDFLGG